MEHNDYLGEDNMLSIGTTLKIDLPFHIPLRILLMELYLVSATYLF